MSYECLVHLYRMKSVAVIIMKVYKEPSFSLSHKTIYLIPRTYSIKQCFNLYFISFGNWINGGRGCLYSRSLVAAKWIEIWDVDSIVKWIIRLYQSHVDNDNRFLVYFRMKKHIFGLIRKRFLILCHCLLCKVV